MGRMLWRAGFLCEQQKNLHPGQYQRRAGSEWAAHNTIGGKPKSEKTGVKLKKRKFTITLDSQFGESPRVTLALINKMVEEGRWTTSLSEVCRSECASIR